MNSLSLKDFLKKYSILSNDFIDDFYTIYDFNENNNEFCSYVFFYRNNNCDEIKYINSQAIEFYNMIKYDQIIEISIIDYLNLPESKKQILKGYKTPITFPEKKLPLDPYVIGIWLGDVNTDNYNKDLKENEYNFMGILKNLQLLNNKHIPLLYKCNSKKNQLSLLAGLIDSKGTFSKKKGFTLSFNILNKTDNLIKDIIHILHWLISLHNSIQCIFVDSSSYLLFCFNKRAK